MFGKRGVVAGTKNSIQRSLRSVCRIPLLHTRSIPPSLYSRHNFISGGMQNEPCTQTGRELPFSVNNQTGRKFSFSASVRVTETIKIGLGYLITALLGMLYGPFTAALAAGAGDLIKYLLKPDGAYFFGFTLTAMLGGVVYGVFFYREKCTIPRAIASKATVSLLLNCLLNTVWVSWLYGMPFLGALGPRVIKNLMALPFEIVLLYIVLNGMNKVIQRA